MRWAAVNVPEWPAQVKPVWEHKRNGQAPLVFGRTARWPIRPWSSV